MSDLQERINRRTHAEVCYLRGYQRMNLERFRSYQVEFQAAYARYDFRKIHETVKDTVTISNDTVRLIRKRMAVSARRSFTFAGDTANDRDDAQAPPASFPATLSR
ncbi:MAG: hypothetical protein LC793_03305 [Thermomicrobia bacterium]|nr:hypothetical protein [Thermomicrobia bacterium]